MFCLGVDVCAVGFVDATVSELVKLGDVAVDWLDDSGVGVSFVDDVTVVGIVFVDDVVEGSGVFDDVSAAVVFDVSVIVDVSVADDVTVVGAVLEDVVVEG